MSSVENAVSNNLARYYDFFVIDNSGFPWCTPMPALSTVRLNIRIQCHTSITVSLSSYSTTMTNLVEMQAHLHTIRSQLRGYIRLVQCIVCFQIFMLRLLRSDTIHHHIHNLHHCNDDWCIEIPGQLLRS